MNTHNIFSWRNKKNINTFEMKKASYQELGTSHPHASYQVTSQFWLWGVGGEGF